MMIIFGFITWFSLLSVCSVYYYCRVSNLPIVKANTKPSLWYNYSGWPGSHFQSKETALILPRIITYLPAEHLPALFSWVEECLIYCHSARYLLALCLRGKALRYIWHSFDYHHKPMYVAKEVWKCSWWKSWLHTTENVLMEGAIKVQCGMLPWAISNYCIQPIALVWEP